MILDFKENLQLPDQELKRHYDARVALACLDEGLYWLYGEVSKIEREIRRDAQKDDVQMAVVGGILDNKPVGILSCAFRWYTVSACNYAQLIGRFDMRDTTAAKDYECGLIRNGILSSRNHVEVVTLP